MKHGFQTLDRRQQRRETDETRTCGSRSLPPQSLVGLPREEIQGGDFWKGGCYTERERACWKSAEPPLQSFWLRTDLYTRLRKWLSQEGPLERSKQVSPESSHRAGERVSISHRQDLLPRGISLSPWKDIASFSSVQSLSRVRLFVTPWTVACWAPLSMGFSRQEYWSGLSFPPPGDLPNPEIEPGSPASPGLAGRFFTTEPLGKPYTEWVFLIKICIWIEMCFECKTYIGFQRLSIKRM